MNHDYQNMGFLKRSAMRAAKLPIIYVTIGVVFTILSYGDNAFAPLSKWKNFFDISEKIGNIFGALAILSFVFSFITLVCHRYEKRLSDKHKVLAVILLSVRKALRVIYILAILNIVVNMLEPTQLFMVYANNLINAIIISAIGWVAIQVLYTIETALHQYTTSISNHDHIRAKILYTKMRIIRNIATVVIVIVTVAAILMSFSSVRSIGISLLASAGFFTAIIGLSAQKTLFSLFSGLQIVISQPIKIGDIVEIEGESGLIEEITFTYVTLKLGDRRRLIVPINYFIDKPFENWSREGNSLRSSLHFHVDYMMPIEPLREELARILQKSPYWDGEAQKLQVSDLTDHSVQIRLQVSAADADHLSDLRAEVREKMLQFIRENYPRHFPSDRLHNYT